MQNKTILFTPSIYLASPSRPMVKGHPFPMEYVKWHKALVNYFSTRKDYQFIWKGLFLPNQKIDLIYELIAQENYNNIRFESGKPNRYFRKAEKIICDSPSSAFFECIFANLPVLALYRPKDQKLRKNALNIFGSSLKPYNNIDEGIKHVDNYLNSESKDYIVHLETENISVADILNI